MGYYSGGLRGDYYKGDPGFLSTLGGIVRTVGGAIPGVGGLLSAGGSLLEKMGTKAAVPAGTSIVKAALPRLTTAATSGVGKLATKGLKVASEHPVLTAAGAAGIAGAAVGGVGATIAAHMRGAHKRHRRMRVTNPKALRRAIRRTTGFAKLAMKTIHLVHPHKKVRFGGFRRRKRK